MGQSLVGAQHQGCQTGWQEMGLHFEDPRFVVRESIFGCLRLLAGEGLLFDLIEGIVCMIECLMYDSKCLGTDGELERRGWKRYDTLKRTGLIIRVWRRRMFKIQCE